MMSAGKPRNNNKDRNRERERSPYDQRVVELARVTRVTEGGKRMSFRACVVVGNRQGLVGYAIAKGADVQAAIGKAVRKAEKSLITVPMVKQTIPHAIETKFKAARILLKPAPSGSGVIAGGTARIVLELAGIPNISGKTLGSGNKINNVHATFKALSTLAAGTWRLRRTQQSKANRKKVATP